MVKVSDIYKHLEPIRPQLERNDRENRYGEPMVVVLCSGDAEVIKRGPHKNRRGDRIKKPLYQMSPEMRGEEELAQAWNCLIDLHTVPNKMKIATRFLKLLLKTHKHNALHELLMAVEQLTDTAAK